MAARQGPKTALMLISDGADATIVTTIANVLRCGQIILTIASVSNTICVSCNYNVRICTDGLLPQFWGNLYDIIIFPTELQEGIGKITDVLQWNTGSNVQLIAAIGTGFITLVRYNVGKNKRVTYDPEIEGRIATQNYIYVPDDVVIDENLITSQGRAVYKFTACIVKKLNPQAYPLIKDQFYQIEAEAAQ